jgi:hypothetical protein
MTRFRIRTLMLVIAVTALMAWGARTAQGLRVVALIGILVAGPLLGWGLGKGLDRVAAHFGRKPEDSDRGPD